MKLNKSVSAVLEVTHEGAPAKRINAYQQLRRSVLSCLLWEKEFYEEGQAISDRIEEYAAKVTVPQLASLAIEARKKFNLRHVPLLLLCVLAKRGGKIVGDTIAETISRADELAELLSVYWRKGKCPLSNQLKIGLAQAFLKFDEYALAKYNRDEAIKLRDVLFLCHAKPDNKKQEKLWKKLVDGTLKAPDTWEVALSAGKDKKATFERLIKEGMIGYLALLRNLRNMTDAGVDRDLMAGAILARKGAHVVLPFRYVAAARYCPQMEPYLDQALSEAIAGIPVLKGNTVILVDVSGSMYEKLSGKSDMTRMDAAAALGSIVHTEKLRLFTFSSALVEVPPRRGMAGVEAIKNSQGHSSTNLGAALERVLTIPNLHRLIVITDEQSHDRVSNPTCEKAYMINVDSAKNGVGYGKHWIHLDGFSENVIRYIHEIEEEND